MGIAFTANSNQNALLIASRIIYQRILAFPNSASQEFLNRLQNGRFPSYGLGFLGTPLVLNVLENGPIVDWTLVSDDERILQIMERLINLYAFPVNGAAGVVGNLWAESKCLPNSIEGSIKESPMRTFNFYNDKRTDFDADEVYNRNDKKKIGPRLAGVGLVQWTYPKRRAGLFKHAYKDQVLGADILFHLDAQIDYMVTEMKAKYQHTVYAKLINADTSMEYSSDIVAYRYEQPKILYNEKGKLRKFSDPIVQAEFAKRRSYGAMALGAYRAVHPEQPQGEPIFDPQYARPTDVPTAAQPSFRGGAKRNRRI